MRYLVFVLVTAILTGGGVLVGKTVASEPVNTTSEALALTDISPKMQVALDTALETQLDALKNKYGSNTTAMAVYLESLIQTIESIQFTSSKKQAIYTYISIKLREELYLLTFEEAFLEKATQ